MPKKILRSVRFKGKLYVGGMERDFVKSGITYPDVIRLEESGIISGFVKKDKPIYVPPEVERTGLDVHITQLAKFLLGVIDPKLIENWNEEDLRPQSHALYERALTRIERDVLDREARDIRVAMRLTNLKANPGGPKRTARAAVLSFEIEEH